MGTTSLTPCIRSCPTRFRRSSGHAPILPPHTEIFNHETLVTQPPLHPIAPFIRALSYSPITISPTETRKFLKHLARHHCWSLRLHSSRSVLRGRCARPALQNKTHRVRDTVRFSCGTREGREDQASAVVSAAGASPEVCAIATKVSRLFFSASAAARRRAASSCS